MKIVCGKKAIDIKLKKTSQIGKYTGLMFRTKNTKNLLFEFGSSKETSIHSLFVFFPFLAVWLNSKNEVTDFRIINPFTFYSKPKGSSVKLIELPVNMENQGIINFFVGEGKI